MKDETKKIEIWKKDSFLSLAGVFEMTHAKDVPAALSGYLQRHHEVKTIHLHLDNDEVVRSYCSVIIWRSLSPRL